METIINNKSTSSSCPVFLMTNDVETTSIYHNSLRDKTGIRVYNEAMPKLLDLYDKYDIKCTFFFTAYIAKLIPDIVKMVYRKGHEIASHGYSHLPQNSFDIISYDRQIRYLKDSKNILEDIVGDKVISFRAPAARVQKNTATALIETGFEIDSSISSQRFDFFLTFGNMMKLRWLFAPRLPYYTDSNNIFKPGSSALLELPISALVMPYIGTTLRIVPFLTKILSRILLIENKLNNKPLLFLFHPNELIDESHEKYIGTRRAGSYVSYLLGDVLRRKLKLRNLGQEAYNLVDNVIATMKHKKARFLTCSQYRDALVLPS